VEIRERLKKLERLLEEARKNWVFVEGRRDKEALRALGADQVLTISGNLRQSCSKLPADVNRVYVLSDLDRRGDEMALRAREELESRSIRADVETRRKLAHLLRIRFFEDAKRAYDKLREEAEKGP
jgi:5S rRNA maturation endonuclease (ribonuclease M5)